MARKQEKKARKRQKREEGPVKAEAHVARPKHPDKEIEKELKHADQMGWRWKPPGKSAHVWGTLLCPDGTRDGCRFWVYSTPSVSEDHARAIRNTVDRCTHGE